MKLLSNYIGRRALIVTALASFLLISFQNCGKAGFESSTSSSSDTISTATAIETSAPFAYKATFDTIAYNSCFSSNGNSLSSTSTYFTFRAGAYSTGGVRVSKNFMDYAKSSLRPSYPSPTITAGQYKELLQNSPINKGAQLQFAMRQLSNVQTPDGIYRSGTTATVGIDFLNVLGPLTDDRWGGDLMNKAMTSLNTGSDPDFNQYFYLGPRGYRNLEVTQSWNSGEGLAQSVRNSFGTDAALTLTVSDESGTAGQSKSSTTNLTKAYGTAYKLNFGSEIPPFIKSCVPVLANGVYTGCQTPTAANPAPDTLNPDNILTSIQEIDLETGALSSSTWTCDANMRLLVVRPMDQATICPKGEDRTNLDSGKITNVAGYYRDLEQVRRVLPADQWDVNLTRRCVVPKTSDCYTSSKINNLTIPVEYNPTKTCFQALDSVVYPGAAPTNVCAQYVTICTK